MADHDTHDHTGIPGVGGSGIPDTILDAKGDMIAASAADTAAKVTVGANGTVLTADSAATPGVAWKVPNGTLLKVTSSTAGDCETNSATLVDADATNLSAAFTVPTSGKVLVRLTAAMTPSKDGDNATSLAAWGIRESSSTIAGPSSVARAGVAPSSNVTRVVSVAFYITGLTPGASLTYKWAHQVSADQTVIFASGTTPAVMEVWAAP